MKKITASLLSLFLTMSLLASTAFAAEQPTAKQLSLQIDGVLAQVEDLVLENGTTYAPADSFLKALQLDQQADAGAEAIIATKEGIQLEINLKELVGSVNDLLFPITAAPKPADGVVYIPVRAIGEAVGYEVGWDAATRTVTLAEIPRGKGFLWEVKHEDNTVYLLGSMHFADKSFYPLQPAVEQAFAQAEHVGVEVDVTQAASPEVQEIVQSLSTYQDGKTLKDDLSEETYATLGELLKENGMPENAFDTYKPWFVTMGLATLPSLTEGGYQYQIGIDHYFIERARMRNLPIIELESWESQLKMMDGFSPELQEQQLIDTIKSYEEAGEAVDSMAAMWKTGDDAGLLEFTGAMSTNEEYKKAMLTDRNIAMADKVKQFLTGEDDDTYLIIVGAAHMLGDDGIVPLLEKKVTR